MMKGFFCRSLHVFKTVFLFCWACFRTQRSSFLLNFFVVNSSINQAPIAVDSVLLLSHAAAFDSSENPWCNRRSHSLVRPMPRFFPLGLPAQVISCDCCYCIHSSEPLQMPSTQAPLTGWLACMDEAWALRWLVLSVPSMGSGSPLQKTQLAVCCPPIKLTPAAFHMTGLVLQDWKNMLLYSECQCQRVSLNHANRWLSFYVCATNLQK